MTAPTRELPTGLPPIGLARIEAARYVGVSPSTFARMVKDGLMPSRSVSITGTVWDRRRLDAAFGALSGDACGRSVGSARPVMRAPMRIVVDFASVLTDRDRHGNRRVSTIGAARASQRSGFMASPERRSSRGPTICKGCGRCSGPYGGARGPVAAAEGRHLPMAVRPILRRARVQAARPAHAAHAPRLSSRPRLTNRSRRAISRASLICRSTA